MKYPEPFEIIWKKVKPFTMTSRNRGYALYEAVNYVVDNNIQGGFVECGVWRGGSSMIIALALLDRGVSNRAIHLFDTFEGMTPPTDDDRDPSGRAAAEIMADETLDGLTHAVYDIESVRKNMISSGYPRNLIRYVKGDVCKTLPDDKQIKISLLRLDTDFFDSTEAELIHLYPKVSPLGVIIIDDYGHWQGARKAVDAFLKTEKAAGHTHFLTPLDYTGRLFVKPAFKEGQAAPYLQNLERHDYISEGLQDPDLVGQFQFLEPTDPMPVKWKYLRRDVPHIWRTDKRSEKPNIGVLSVDEGAILYNAALPFEGKRGLEIGCHLAFSTAHLLKAGLDLDVIDPALGNAVHLEAVQDNLNHSVPDNQPRLHAGFSPGIVNLVHSALPLTKWSFAFIDGLHDGSAPLDDACTVEPLMASTAAVMFHDLTCPDVARGLQYYANAGWQTKIYETMQVMGIAWRGDYLPPEHIPDAGTSVSGMEHLL
ncbi:TylF/MycF/NovP-related O-methyltransferase [Falsihalocynthiibacter sp. BN13B15]|uniref:class I SAM-dependent methyltransferase n=1 Tax=Falsihalocynthiibacter sp. BN13B15 TaxID=3240871 RepID=UPI00350ECDCE